MTSHFVIAVSLTRLAYYSFALAVKRSLELFGRVRKNFKICKGIIGYSEGMYNFTEKSGQNLYDDRLSLRLGIEVKIKKKPKKNSYN